MINGGKDHRQASNLKVEYVHSTTKQKLTGKRGKKQGKKV